MGKIESLPGYEEALSRGYSLLSYSEYGDRADYCKMADSVSITLTVHKRCQGCYANLWAMIGLVEIKISMFSFPHRMFDKFEDKIFDAVLKLGG
jgi:hypothetical protein